MATVLKKFLWSRNGHDVESVQPGDERDFGTAATGLAAEGFITTGEEQVETPAETPAAEPAVEPGTEAATEPAVETPAETPAAEPRRRKAK